MKKIKDFLTTSLGIVGFILYFLISIILYYLPFLYIDVHFLLLLLFGVILSIFPLTSIIFWIWGLIEVINHFSGFAAIIYYIIFAIAWIPFFISSIRDIVEEIQFRKYVKHTPQMVHWKSNEEDEEDEEDEENDS